MKIFFTIIASENNAELKLLSEEVDPGEVVTLRTSFDSEELDKTKTQGGTMILEIVKTLSEKVENR